MDKIEVTQKVRVAAFDAYMTCFETVPNDLWLQALLDGKHDSDEMAQAFARFERDILATRTDATPVAVEMVAELQLSAFLAGRGSIRTKANGNTHESSPGPTMDDYRRMARFALAEGWVDATPVAWMPMESAPEDEPILTAIKVNHKNGKSWWERHIIVIDSETGTISDMDFHHGWEVQEYTFWQPLPAAPDASYTHPPATDVAALVDDSDAWFQVGALKEQLRQANETIKAINSHLPAYAAAMKENKELKADVAALVEALRFYAGLLSFPYNAWVQPSVVDYSKGGDGHHPDGPPIPSDTLLLDGGKHARQALAPFTKGQNDG